MNDFYRILLHLFFCAVGFSAGAQNGKVVQRIYLVGDAGELKNGKNIVCDWLRTSVEWKDSSNTLIFLGDNIYPAGMPAEGASGSEHAKRVMDYQMSVTGDAPAKVFFVPGNHDWKEGRSGAWDQVRRQQAFIESKENQHIQMLPKGGCPGPEELVINDRLVLVFMDSQWWLQDADRPGAESDCDCKNEDEIVSALSDIIAAHKDKLIVLAMHHPFYTHGKHGGYFTLKQHIFPLTEIMPLYLPLPVVGSIYPVVRGVFGNIQDTRHPRYRDMIKRIEAVMQGNNNIVHVAGHEHNLQLLRKDSLWFVVSGSGSKTTQVKKGEHTVYEKRNRGFSVIELDEYGKAAVKFYRMSGDSAVMDFSTPLNIQYRLPVSETGKSDFPDSVTIAATGQFKSNGLKRFLLGANYRDEWRTPVKVKVFDMTGWKPLKRGGGKQSRSLRLADGNEKQYVLRSIRKYVLDDALPPDLRGTFVKDLVTDGVSASYPYAALSIPALAEALGVPHAEPRLVYVPDDPRLGKFRADFANTLCIFEEREPGSEKTYSTAEVEEKLLKDNDNRIDQRAALRARMLDMFVMDFDRHEDQWRWGAVDNGKGKTYFPIPRDRDQPFFISEGVIPYYAGQPWMIPQLQGFRSKAANINPFNFAARNFDRNFLNEISEEEWRKTAEHVLQTMTDELIDRAMMQQPKELHTKRMKSIASKLKERRKFFLEEMLQYYRFLSATVTIALSNKHELVEVIRTDKTLHVKISKLNKEGVAGQKLFERIFTAEHTKELRIYAHGGKDSFRVSGSGGGNILVRLIGGKGEDIFESNAQTSSSLTRIYDAGDSNTVKGNGAHKYFRAADHEGQEYNPRSYKYNILAPFVAAGFNPDDGVSLGATLKYTVHGFRKQPFRQQHSFFFTHALRTKAFDFRYRLEAIDAIGKGDLLFNLIVKAPNNTINFFGLGNESGYNKKTAEGIRFYRARFNLVESSVLLRAGKKFSIAAGPAFQFYTMDSAENKSRFINQTNINGLNRNIYSSKLYAGIRLATGIDNRNSKTIPTRGANFQTSLTALRGLNSESGNPTQLNSDLSFFISFSRKALFVIGSRIGGGINFGKYEFFQAQYLSGTENLRGYRKFRFMGDRTFYHNLDLRFKIAEFKSYLFPGAIGLVSFHDVGRVWLKGENSSEWHQGYGAGIWLAPLSRFVITGSYARGSDGPLGLVTFGFQF